MTDTPETTPEQPPVPSERDEALAALHAELEVARARYAQSEERLRTLAAADIQPATAEDDDEEEPSTATGQQRDRSKPPSWEDFDRLEARQRKAAKEAQQLRAERRRQQEAWDAEDAKRREEDERKAALLAAEQKARAEAESLYRPATIRAAAVPALVDAGARSDRIDDLFAFLRQDELSVDGHKVEGLDQQVSALRARYPEWFQAQTEERPRAPRVTTGDRPPVVDTPKRSADIIARLAGFGGAA